VILAASLTDRFDQPAALWLLALALLMAWMARRSLAGLTRGRWRAAVLMRAALILLLVMALAGLNTIRKNRDLTVIYLLDKSRSVPDDQQAEARRFARVTSRTPQPDDRVGVILFDGQPYIEQLPSKPGPDGGLFPDVTLTSPGIQPDRTNIAAAIRMAMACFPDDTARRLVLLSDGNQNVGDVMQEIETAAANRISIDVAPMRYEYDSEVMFERLSAPAYAREQEIATLRLTLRSRRAATGRINVYHDGKIVDLDPDSPETGQRVELEPGLNTYVVRLPLTHSGTHQFEARFEPDDPRGDSIAANNVATAFTSVEGPARVLMVSQAFEDDRALVEALRKEKILVDLLRPAEADLDPISLQQYGAVILANVPADQFSGIQHRSLATYVRDLGGGLIMLGGNESFGAGGWQSSVVEAVMPVRFDVDEKREIPRGALAIVLHACEMPQGNYWAIETAVAAMKTLSRLDYFGIVSWGLNRTGWEIPMQTCSDKERLTARIRKVRHGDAPSFDDMMDLAGQGLIACRDAAQRHMIVISDGDPAPPTAGTINKLVGARITVSTVQVFPHTGSDEATMRRIAEQTGGSTYMVNRLSDASRLPQIFIKEARIVRRPLLREQDFKPQVRMRASDLLAGLDLDLPNLRGHVVTTPRSPAEIEMPLVSDKGDPILANWQVGLGRAVAFTSGWWNFWGPDWSAWPGFSKFWAQVVRWCMAQGTAKDFEVMSFVNGERGRIVVEALKRDADYLNFLQLQGLLVQPTGESRPLRLEQTGPGRYEGTFEMTETGTYLVNLRAAGAEQEPVLIRSGISLAYSPEFKDLSANESLLRRIVERTGGRWLDGAPEEANVFLHNLPESFSRRPLWDVLLKLALLCFLMDVAVRRIAIDPRRAAAWVRGYVADLAGRFAPGRRAEVVLADLKSVRDRVRADRTAAGESPTRPAVSVDGAKRFEAPTDAAGATGDLSAALGGATPEDKPKAVPPGAEQKPPESTTARLLKSKRRRGSESES
jgi:uncharacterized membrane protein